MIAPIRKRKTKTPVQQFRINPQTGHAEFDRILTPSESEKLQRQFSKNFTPDGTPKALIRLRERSKSLPPRT